MAIQAEDLDFLASDAGTRLLAALAHEDLSDAHTLTLLTRLRRSFTGEQAGAALELARLRKAAIPKFGSHAARMYFTRDALEQASDPTIREWRAALAASRCSAQTVADVCCSIGSDSFAFAAQHLRVHGIDHDALRIRMAALNAEALALQAAFEVGDARDGIAAADLVFFDPGRRTETGARIYHVEGYQPPLSLIHGWNVPSCWVKASPGVELERLPATVMHGPPRVYFISVNGELKEAMLSYGLGDAADSARVAILLRDGAVHEWQSAQEACAVTVFEPRAWLCEPDPAVIRAGLVADVASSYAGALLDETIAYFTTETRPDTPWLRAWEIEAWIPFSLKRLRGYLRARRVGSITVKKRGTAVTPDVLIPQLKLKGEQERVVVLTRYRGAHIAIICQPYVV
jgi:hypothetical protein